MPRVSWLLPPLLVAGLVLVVPDLTAGAGAGRGRAAVASESALSTREALAQLAHGGNAIDAAVTAAFVAGVTSPSSSGLGGGGFAVLWLAADRRAVVLDFREVAPPDTEGAAFEQRPFEPGQRGKLVGVPGEVAGLWELHHRYGKRSWREVVTPAADLARNGFAVGRHLGRAIDGAREALALDVNLAATYLPGAKPAAVGAKVTNPKLAAALDRIAAEGAAGFYRGPVAADLVAGARGAGGWLTEAALAAYQPKERTPLRVDWDGKEIYTMPLPSAGGLMLAETLGTWSAAELRRAKLATGAYTHLLAETLRGASADRLRYLGDPDFEAVDVGKLLAPARLAERKRHIAADRTHALPRFGLEEHGTHHLVTADAGGNFVSLTTTINGAFGARVASPEYGVLLNDQLDDFTTQKAVAPLGLSTSPNRARAGARPVSSMTPTVVVQGGQVVLAIGGSGGTTIATNVTQVLLSRLVFGTKPEAAVSAPRFYVPFSGPTITLDAGNYDELARDLAGRGEIVQPQRFTQSAVQLIAAENGLKEPAGDPRKFSVAAAR